VKRSELSNIRVPGTSLQGGRAIAVYALALYILVFIALNDKKLQVNFVLFKIQSNELIALILIVALSFAAGFFIARYRQPRHHHTVTSRTIERAPDDTAHAEPDHPARPADPEHPAQITPESAPKGAHESAPVGHDEAPPA
jgi:hypothetical protein